MPSRSVWLWGKRFNRAAYLQVLMYPRQPSAERCQRHPTHPFINVSVLCRLLRFGWCEVGNARKPLRLRLLPNSWAGGPQGTALRRGWRGAAFLKNFSCLKWAPGGDKTSGDWFTKYGNPLIAYLWKLNEQIIPRCERVNVPCQTRRKCFINE